MPTRIAIHLSAATIAVGLALFGAEPARCADCDSIVITNEPRDLVVYEGCPVTFTVGLTGSAPYSYQWWRDEEAVPDATNSSYTIPIVAFSDHGTRILVTISNDCSHVTSSEASLYVWGGAPIPPRLLRARGDSTLGRVLVSFYAAGDCGLPGLDVGTSQDPYNYACTGGLVVSNAMLDPTGTNVLLTTSRQSPGTIYTLMVDGVTDRRGNPVPGGSQTLFQAWVLLPGSDPPVFGPPPVNISVSGKTNCITWPPGSTLQEADQITGPWSTVSGAVCPYQPPATNTARFFRAFFDP